MGISSTTIIRMDVSCIDSESEFQDLTDDWNRLAALTAPESVFLRHEWFDAAWQWLKRDCLMAILCVRKGQSLTGICPLVARKVQVHGIRIRTLEFLNIPDTQYCDVLAKPDQRSEIIAAVMGFLCSSNLKWDRLELCKLDAGSNVMLAVPEYARRESLLVSVQEDDMNPSISLGQTWEEFYSRRSRRLKKGNNHVANRIRRAGKHVELTHLEAGSEDGEKLSVVLDAAIQLSSRSWKSTTRLTLDNPGPFAFINRLTEHAQQKDWLSFWLLKVDNIPVAMEYQLVYGGIVSALRADYDLAFEDLSPGTYMNWKMLEQLFDGNCRHYCMGPGGNTYKLRWAEEFPVQYRITLYNNTVRGKMLSAIDLRLRPFAKYIVGLVKGGEKGEG